MSARRRGSGASHLVALVEDAYLLHTSTRETFADIPVGTHRETWPVLSREFRELLAERYYRRFREVPSGSTLDEAREVIAGRARFQAPQEEVFVRVAEHGGGVYLDLGDADWRVVEVTASGWQVISTAPVRFRRPNGMRALPSPEPDGDIEDLRQFLNVATDDDWCLAVGWLVGSFRPSGPYTALGLHGEQGSAKSTTTRVLRALIDPNSVPLRGLPRNDLELAITAANTWCPCFDNLSRLSQWQSDSLCRLATGGGLSTRTLYTTGDETLFNATRPFITNGITDPGMIVKPDLLDRMIVVELPAIPDASRQDEAVFWRTFEKTRPALLGALLDAVVVALRELPTVSISAVPRMADFAKWVVAAEAALPWTGGAFVEAYCVARAVALDTAADESFIAALVKIPLPWRGSATELVAVLRAGGHVGLTSHSVRSVLARQAPILRARGVNVAQRRTGRGRWIELSAATTASSPASSSPGMTGNTASETTEAGPYGAIDGDGSDASDATVVGNGSCNWWAE